MQSDLMIIPLQTANRYQKIFLEAKTSDRRSAMIKSLRDIFQQEWQCLDSLRAQVIELAREHGYHLIHH